MPRLYIRIYLAPISAQDSHSFLVGHESGGLSTRLEGLVVEKDATFKSVRGLIEVKKDGLLGVRRSPLFQEIAFRMQQAPNVLGYDGTMRTKYCFGVVDLRGGEGTAESCDDIKLIGGGVFSEAEDRKLADFIEDFRGQDLVVVPLTQILPDGSLLRSAGECDKSCGGSHPPQELMQPGAMNSAEVVR